MKYILLSTALIFSYFASAGVNSLWSEDTAIIVIQGPDTDSAKLYDLLNVDETKTDNPNIFTKSLSFENESSEIVFDLNCRQSKVASTTSCTLNIFDGDNSYLKKSKRFALVRVFSGAMDELFSSFKNENGLVELFRSEENQLSISLEYDHDGNPKLFRIAYRDSGLTV